MRRLAFRWDRFVVAVVLAAALHEFVLIPRLLAPLLEKREQPMEVAFVSDSPDTPTDEDAPSIDPREEPTPEATEQKKEERKRREREAAEKLLARIEREKEKPLPAPPEPAKVEEKKPKPVEVVKAPPPPPPPMIPMQRQKMVDQDRFDEEQDNPDAKYLAQKNHRTVEDRSGRNSNLVRNVEGQADPASEKSESKAPDPGAKEHKIAELEDRKGAEHQIVRGSPLHGQEGVAPRPERSVLPDGPRKLAMRDLTPRALEQSAGEPKREGVELVDKERGTLPQARVGDGGERVRAAQKGGPRVKLQLDALDYDRIEGEAAAAAERKIAAKAERSHVGGRWDRLQQKLTAMRSSLENFTPDARPGNMAELGTRAHPFAAYIAGMHRSIHKLWAFGFVADIEGHGFGGQYSDLGLWTQLEIVLKGDGAVEKVTVVRPSGLSAFDAAAIDTVMSGGPYGPPPESIKSANGKVYVDWRFHRDDRLCATDFVDPHILTTVAENDKHDTTEVGNPPPVAPPRVLRRETPPRATVEGSTVESPAASSIGDGATVPAEAKDAAEGWFAAWVRGDMGWLAGWSASPLSAGGQVVAKDGAAVKKVYADMLKETPSSAARRLDKLDVLTAGGIRARLGGLPPGGEGDGSMVFAVAEIEKEQIILLLKKSDHGWRVTGIDR